MTAERKRVPEVHLEIVRRLSDANKFRPEAERLPIPSKSTSYREIDRKPLYEIMVARYGKRRTDRKFPLSGAGPDTSRALQRVSMDHTPSDIIVVDDNTMLPLGRPTITSAVDEHTRCPMGFYAGFEPPSCLSVMRCLDPVSENRFAGVYSANAKAFETVAQKCDPHLCATKRLDEFRGCPVPRGE